MENSSKETMIQLNLSLEQAFFLRQILRNVGGDPYDGCPRAYTDSIERELAQYDGDFEDLDLPEWELEGGIYIDNVDKGKR